MKEDYYEEYQKHKCEQTAKVADNSEVKSEESAIEDDGNEEIKAKIIEDTKSKSEDTTSKGEDKVEVKENNKECAKEDAKKEFKEEEIKKEGKIKEEKTEEVNPRIWRLVMISAVLLGVLAVLWQVNKAYVRIKELEKIVEEKDKLIFKLENSRGIELIKNELSIKETCNGVIQEIKDSHSKEIDKYKEMILNHSISVNDCETQKLAKVSEFVEINNKLTQEKNFLELSKTQLEEKYNLCQQNLKQGDDIIQNLRAGRPHQRGWGHHHGRHP